MPGPPPKHPSQRVRRNSAPGLTPLPAAGRPGAPPEWPLGEDIVTRAKVEAAEAKVEALESRMAEGASVESSLARARERAAILSKVVEIQRDRELALWRELWATPQAVQWERLRWTREVAAYARWKVLAESGDLNAAKEARQLADRLGLTPLALLRLRWEIVDMSEPALVSSPAEPGTVTPINSRRTRLSG